MERACHATLLFAKFPLDGQEQNLSNGVSQCLEQVLSVGENPSPRILDVPLTCRPHVAGSPHRPWS